MGLSIEVQGANAIVADFEGASARATKASVRAINRAITSGRAYIASEMAGDLGLKVREVRDAIRMRKASFERPEARLAATLKQIPLSKFKFRGPRPSRGRGNGVTVQLPSGTARHAHAFIAKVRGPLPSGIFAGGHEGIFVRAAALTHKSRGAWSANLPIKQLYGPSLGLVFQKHRPAAIAHMTGVFDTNFAHEFAFAGTQRA